MSHWAVPQLHTGSQHSVQNDSLKDNSSPPAASFDRAASSGNSTFSKPGFSAPSVELSQPSHSSPNSSIYRFGKGGDMEKQGGKDRRHLRRGAGKTTQMKVCRAHFPEAEIPSSIKTRCLSNRAPGKHN